MFPYSNYEEARKHLEDSKSYHLQRAYDENLPVEYAFRLGRHDDRYFSHECHEVSRLQRFAEVEFIDRDQVYWLTCPEDDLDFHNAGIEDWVKNPFYSSGK